MTNGGKIILIIIKLNYTTIENVNASCFFFSFYEFEKKNKNSFKCF